MPPKPKFTKEEIAGKALEIIRTQGNSEFTARKLGTALGVSSRPLFTAFKNMEEIRHAAREIAIREFDDYKADCYDENEPSFKKIGLNMVDYAIKQPEVFKLIFMEEDENRKSIKDITDNLGKLSKESMKILVDVYGLSPKQAEEIFQQVWVFTFGLASLCAMKVCRLSMDEASAKLSEVFLGALERLKNQK